MLRLPACCLHALFTSTGICHLPVHQTSRSFLPLPVQVNQIQLEARQSKAEAAAAQQERSRLASRTKELEEKLEDTKIRLSDSIRELELQLERSNTAFTSETTGMAEKVWLKPARSLEQPTPRSRLFVVVLASLAHLRVPSLPVGTCPGQAAGAEAGRKGLVA